jgi:hypothetical protein
MKKYTVVGFYADNDQVFVEHTKANSPETAVLFATANLSSKPVIVDVFNGHLKGLLIHRLDQTGYGKVVFLD